MSISNKKLLTEKMMVRRMSTVSIIGNVFLSVFKMIAGVIAHSSAMISDAIHSFSDVMSTVIAIIGVIISKREADKSHPYGHERLECVASIILCAILFIVGLMIGYNGIANIVSGEYRDSIIPGGLALLAAIISIITKELMYQYTRYYAKKMDSSVFMADAWHHRSDALSSVGALIGIGGSILGFPILEQIACIVICIFIVKASYDIFMDALDKMLDTPCSDECERKLYEYIASQDGVIDLDLLHTRKFGNKIYIDTEIRVNGNISLREAHDIAEKVHDGVEMTFDNIKHIMIHVNPDD